MRICSWFFIFSVIFHYFVEWVCNNRTNWNDHLTKFFILLLCFLLASYYVRLWTEFCYYFIRCLCLWIRFRSFFFSIFVLNSFISFNHVCDIQNLIFYHQRGTMWGFINHQWKIKLFFKVINKQKRSFHAILVS